MTQNVGILDHKMAVSTRKLQVRTLYVIELLLATSTVKVLGRDHTIQVSLITQTKCRHTVNSTACKACAVDCLPLSVWFIRSTSHPRRFAIVVDRKPWLTIGF